MNYSSSGTAPVNDFINFEDTWNYKLQPHNTPLLQEPLENHILPATYEYEKDLKVYSLEDKNDKTVFRVAKKIGSVVKERVPCGVCQLGVGLLQTEVKKGSSFDSIKAQFVGLCVSFKIEIEKVCAGFFDVFAPELLPAYNASNLDPADTCSLIFGEPCGEIKNAVHHQWNIDIPKKPRQATNHVTSVKPGLPIFKVLHISDTHLDPEYEVGTPANCEEPLCCRNYSTPSAKETTILSGRWGSYDKCDAPRNLIENMLKNIALQHWDIDYIIWTGDLPPHDIWNQTKEGNLEIIKETVQQMFNYFPNVPIFPAIGNHESVPAGNFAPPWMNTDDHSANWLYQTMADQWRRWLPSSTGNTVLHGGFYSVLLRPGFRLISLNTNYCHTLSWWLLVNSTDPGKELKWLIHELQNAEDNGEKVHIIGHIPPGSFDCMKTWSSNFYSIVDRFQDTIVAQFYGHSHADEFELFYETQKYSRPIAVAYLGPSVTTFENFNPAYRVYYVDGDRLNSTREVLDHETWTMDLDKANKEDKDPTWYKLYTAKDAYAMESLKPEEWNKLVERMVNDQDLFDLFYKNYYRDSPVRPFCDAQCKLQILCDLKSGKSNDRRHLCHELEFL
nr:sphingomyelin phosphodiesterase-like [Leptinotarsa decemlineata]